MVPLQESIKAIERYSLSDADVRKILGRKCRIIKYSEFSKYSDLDILLPNEKHYVVVLIEESPDRGHWCSLSKFKNKYQWFDAYGFRVDADLKWTSMSMRKSLHEDVPYLTNLLNRSDMDCIYNKVKYQKMSSDVNTCGDHVCHYIHRMLKHDMDLQDYYIYMKNIKRTSGYTYDEIVSIWVAKYLK